MGLNVLLECTITISLISTIGSFFQIISVSVHPMSMELIILVTTLGEVSECIVHYTFVFTKTGKMHGLCLITLYRSNYTY